MLTVSNTNSKTLLSTNSYKNSANKCHTCPCSSNAITTTAAPYLRISLALVMKSASPSFRLILLTTHLPWVHRSPASITAKFDESIHSGTCTQMTHIIVIVIIINTNNNNNNRTHIVLMAGCPPDANISNMVKPWTSNLAGMFQETIQIWPLKNFLKRGHVDIMP